MWAMSASPRRGSPSRARCTSPFNTAIMYPAVSLAARNYACCMYSTLAAGLLDSPVWASTRAGSTGLERVVAGVRPQLIIDLDHSRAMLIGPRTTSAVVQSMQRSVGVSLTGAGLFSILGSDVGSLVDSAVDVTDVISTDKRGWFEDHPADVEGVVRNLCSRFIPDRRIIFAERELRRGASAREMVELVGMDRRRFVPLFREQIGLTPKTYERLVRFARSIKALRTGGNHSIADVAAASGFADQAHLTREVRELSRTTPSRLTRLPSGPVNHLPHDA